MTGLYIKLMCLAASARSDNLPLSLVSAVLNSAEVYFIFCFIYMLQMPNCYLSFPILWLVQIVWGLCSCLYIVHLSLSLSLSNSLLFSLSILLNFFGLRSQSWLALPLPVWWVINWKHPRTTHTYAHTYNSISVVDQWLMEMFIIDQVILDEL